MSLRTWATAAVILVLVGWWTSPLSPRVPAFAKPAHGFQANCPAPPTVTDGDPPLQSPVPASLGDFKLASADLQPLAGFSVDARVLSRQDYDWGRESQLSPTDLALGWGHMRDDDVLARLDISQASRWYRYQWRGEPPLPPDEIARSSANMHLIPSDAATAAALHGVHVGSRVRINGWLVEATSPDGYRWRSSLTRDDTGAGACEVIYVCSLTSL
jgi:hypothetical protein